MLFIKLCCALALYQLCRKFAGQGQAKSVGCHVTSSTGRVEGECCVNFIIIHIICISFRKVFSELNTPLSILS